MNSIVLLTGWAALAAGIARRDLGPGPLVRIGPRSYRRWALPRSEGHRCSHTDSGSMGDRLRRTLIALRVRRAADHIRYRRELGLLAAAIATGVRSGQTVGQAVAAVHATMGHQWCDRLSSELAACENRIRRGDGIGEALGEWARWSKHVEVELLTAAIRLGTETGGRLADALDGVAATITIRNELHAEQKALSSQARMTARVLVVAPAVFALLAGVIDPRVSRLLIATPLGWAVIALAGLLDLAGWRWMTRIVTRLEAE